LSWGDFSQNSSGHPAYQSSVCLETNAAEKLIKTCSTQSALMEVACSGLTRYSAARPVFTKLARYCGNIVEAQNSELQNGETQIFDIKM
jgi:hypothetical protein